MDLTHQLNWRYVIKRTNCRITAEKLDPMLEKIRSRASSFGLLPHTLHIVDKPEHIDRILPPEMYPHLNKASHLVVFTAWTDIKHENINELIAYIASSQGLSLDNFSDYKATMKLLVKNPAHINMEWSSKQAYIALGVGLAAAAEQQLDAIPVEDFDHSEVNRILNLEQKGLESVILMALGKRDDRENTGRVKNPRREDHSEYVFVN